MILLIGAHGVGKSTLLQKIRDIGFGYYITDGFSRPIKNVKEELNLSNYQEHFIINELTRWNWLNNIDNKYYISTRSIIDSFIYSSCLGYDALAEKYLDIFLQYRDDSKIKYIYIPIEFDLERDGVRFESDELQRVIDKNIRAFLQLYKIPYIEIKGSLDERVKALTAML